jgi:cold shock CspA family protein
MPGNKQNRTKTDVFVHIVDLVRGGSFDPPTIGSRWEFEIATGPKGMNAVNLVPFD